MRRVTQVGASPTTATALVPLGLACTAVAVAQSRGLKYAKTPQGFKTKRMGQRKFPLDRVPVPYVGGRHKFFTPDFWRQRPRYDALLGPENYVCYDHTGRYWLPSHQVFTWQHALSTAPIRFRVYPLQYRIANPARWMVGTELFFWSKQKPHIVDEATISKKQRMRLVKAGFLPK